MTLRIPRLPIGLAAIAALLVLALPPPARAGALPGPALDPADIGWQTVGSSIHFSLRFRNPSGTEPTDAAAGTVHAQEFGVFLPDLNLLHTFNVPPIMPDSFFDVFFDVPRCDLPHGCTPPLAAKRAPAAQAIPCPPFDHWDGNIDVRWNGPGGAGQVFKHIGAPQVCPGHGNSYTHVTTACAFPSPWVIAGVCAGWSVTLVNEDLTPAPNPVPPGWTGFICVSANANVPFGSVCCFTVTFTCLGAPAVINMCATACDCPVPVHPTTWGLIKARYW